MSVYDYIASNIADTPSAKPDTGTERKMSLKETRLIATIVTNLAIFAAYFIIVLGMQADGRFDGEGATKLIGQSVLILIGAQIVATIIIQILATIFHAIVTRGEEPDITDERDKLIELRALRVSFILTGVGILGAMAAMAWGSSVFVTFQIIIAAMTVADFIGNATRLRFYRRGF